MGSPVPVALQQPHFETEQGGTSILPHLRNLAELDGASSLLRRPLVDGEREKVWKPLITSADAEPRRDKFECCTGEDTE